MEKMKCNYRGLVDLSASHLYRDPDIFIRELIQNAHDAILLRRVSEPGHAGRINITLNPENGILTISDDGEGMSQTMIEEFLATVGSSGTAAIKTVLARLGNTDVATVGRFGIGFLSVFTVAERVEVITQHMESGEVWRWAGRGDGAYTLAPTQGMAHTGTDVIVTLNPRNSEYLSEEIVERAIRKYADYLPLPIFLNKRGPVNAMRFPWEPVGVLSPDEWEDNMTEFFERRYRVHALMVAPIDLPKLQTQGVLFLCEPQGFKHSLESAFDLYLDRMLLQSRVTDLLPEWLCLKGVVNTRSLLPNAARDHAIRNEEWHALRDALSETVAEAVHRGMQRNPYLLHGKPARSLCLANAKLPIGAAGE